MSPCTRCGEPSEDAFCGPCAAYLLAFDPFLLRPSVPGPSVDEEVPREVAFLPLDPDEPTTFERVPHSPQGFDEMFLRHIGLPDGGTAPLTRGDRAVLAGRIRAWARRIPEAPLIEQVEALYAEAVSLKEMPEPMVSYFRSLAGIPEPPVDGPHEWVPAPDDESEPKTAEAVAIPRPPVEDSVIPLPAPAPAASVPDLTRALADLRSELAMQKEEFVRWLARQREEMDVQRQQLRAELSHARPKQPPAPPPDDEAEPPPPEDHLKEEVRRLFSEIFSLSGVSRDAAKAIAEVFESHEQLVAAPLGALVEIPEVSAEEAKIVHDAFVGGEIEPPHLLDKAVELLDEGLNEEALEVFDELVRQSPEQTEMWLNRGEMLAMLGRREEAIASFERALAITPTHRGALSEMTNLLFEQGDFGPAASNLYDLLTRVPEESGPWLVRAANLLREGRAADATLIYNAILEADPTNLGANLAFGDLLLAMGDTKKAEEIYTRVLQDHPDSPDALLKKGLLMNRQGRWGAAVQMFNRAISLRWDHQEAWAAKGQVLLTQGRPKDALECFDRLLTFDDRRDDAWLGKAEAHLALGENDKAAEAAGHALSDGPGGDVKEVLERLRESVDRPQVPPMDLAVDLESGDPETLLRMGEMMLDAGNARSAMRAFDQILLTNPRDDRAWFGKGRALYATDRPREAVQCFATAHDLDRKNKDYSHWLEMARQRRSKEESE